MFLHHLSQGSYSHMNPGHRFADLAILVTLPTPHAQITITNLHHCCVIYVNMTAW